ncbi:MAG TPA: TonB-dependent receptor [Vicinamibacterales bacterium]|nr:TonB-dependent receptor [Vicinamibacterales bacterium]
MRIDRTVAFVLVAMLLCGGAAAQTPPAPPPDPPTPDPPTFQDTVQVTATRFGEPVAEVPGSISVVSGDEIRARGATDLRTALALLGGVSVAPGGDAGPAGAVPGLLGVREVDDLLLLIDGIPAGGAFVPQIEAISLNNVERIEVLRGAAPVYFGTTAFAGTINVIHYAAGSADRVTGVHFGSYQSGGVGGAAILSTGSVRQSISAEVSRDNLSDDRANFRRAQGIWRLATQLGAGRFRADVDLLALRQKPNSPAPIDEATGTFSTLLPVDFNQNPANATLDTNRYKVVLDYEMPLSFGRWGNTAAFTQTQTDSVRGFIDAGDTPQPWTARTNADLESFKQSLDLKELFLDSNLTTQPSSRLDLTAGVNLLVGRAGADSLRYGQRLLLDGVSEVPSTDTVNPKGTVDFDDRRRFVGLYAQSHYALTSSTSLLAGLRWNTTHETRNDARVNSRGVRTVTPGVQDVNRLTGSLGAAWRVWQDAGTPISAVTLHGNVGYTFQPAQIDFGPDPEAQPEGGGLLKPETQRSVIAGLKADAPGGRAECDVDAFFVDFYNQPVQATSGGTTVLRSIGQQRYKGIDVEGAMRPSRGLTIKGNIGWSDALYVDYLTNVDGRPTQLAGNHQLLTPSVRIGGGVLYAPERGWRGSLTSNWIGEHWLNSLNTFEAPAYALVDASVGYRFPRFTLAVLGSNLGDRRDAVQLSELGEGQFYRLPARRIDATLTWHYK